VPVQKAQTFLNGIVGNYAFDPLEFTKLKAKEQVEALKAAAGLDFTEVDAERAKAYFERTSVSRDGKEVAAQLAAVDEPAADTPAKEVSAVSLVEALTGMETKRHTHNVLLRSLASCETQSKEAGEKVLELEYELEGTRLLASKLVKELQEKRLDVESSTPPTDEEIAAAKLAINNVETVNRAVRSAAKHAELTAKVTALRLKHASLSRVIEVVDERKAEAIKVCNLPIKGLELTDDGVMFNGVFFSQLSTAEQIRISTLVAMSQNPGLKLIIIREGALMNTDNLGVISKLAADRGFQLWIEKFQENPSDSGFHIIDGAIAFEDGEPVDEQVDRMLFSPEDETPTQEA
jgi:hypothetical protein